MHWNKRTIRIIAIVLLMSQVIVGLNTSTQAPAVEANTIQIGQPENIEGVSAKGYVEIPEGTDWEEMNVVMTNPTGETQVVEAEYDDHSETFQFEKVVDEAGEWTVDALQIKEDGQVVVQEVADVSLQVAPTLEDVYESQTPQIDASTIPEGETLSQEAYLQALTGIFALDQNGEPMEISVTLEGAVSQSYTFFNDGLEISASEPIETEANGEVVIVLDAPGAETVRRTVFLDGPIAEAVAAEDEPVVTDEPLIGEVSLTATLHGDEVVMEADPESDPESIESLVSELQGASEEGVVIEDGVTAYYGAPDANTAPAASTLVEEYILAAAANEMEYTPLPKPDKPMAVRLSGSNRYETAVAISGTAVIKTDYAILVAGDSFADALASSSLSRVYQAPILYSGSSSVHEATLAELHRLGVKTVFLVGGSGTLSKSVEDTLQRSFEIKRFAGSNRYETARLIGQYLKRNATSGTAIVVNGNKLTDALVSGAYASHYGIPILYTTDKSLDAETAAYLKNHFTKAIIVGGTASVSESVENKIRSYGLQVERASGPNRYATSINFAKAYFKNANRVVIASGVDAKLPDGLAGGALGGLKAAPVILSQANTLPKEVEGYFKDHEIMVSYLLGGKTTLSDTLVAQVKKLTSVTAAAEVKKEEVVDDITSREPSPIAKPVADPVKEAWKDGVVKIKLDPGHGWNYNQGIVKSYFEGNQMIYLSYYLQQELESYGFYVENTRMPKGEYESAYDALLAEKAYAASIKKSSINNDIISLADRGQSAAGFDLLLSLHSNAPFNISASELWDSVTSPNKELAKKFLQTVIDTFGHGNRGVKYRYTSKGVNWYGILRNSGATNAMLIEHGFHTSAADANKLLNQDFLKKLAKAEAKTLADYYGLSK